VHSQQIYIIYNKLTVIIHLLQTGPYSKYVWTDIKGKWMKWNKRIVEKIGGAAKPVQRIHVSRPTCVFKLTCRKETESSLAQVTSEGTSRKANEGKESYSASTTDEEMHTGSSRSRGRRETEY
jgi:hypothetical protein